MQPIENKNLRNFLTKIKTKFIYKLFLQFLFVPIYEIFWKNILNFEGRALYFLW